MCALHPVPTTRHHRRVGSPGCGSRGLHQSRAGPRPTGHRQCDTAHEAIGPDDGSDVDIGDAGSDIADIGGGCLADIGPSDDEQASDAATLRGDRAFDEFRPIHCDECQGSTVRPGPAGRRRPG